MPPPKVSAVIPTYNHSHLLPRAINSVLNQTFQDFELIIVDDGSTDNTEEVVKGFNDKRIIYLKRNKNKGPSAARNTGIKSSRGKYIALLDADDEWLPEKLEAGLKVFIESEVENLGAVGSNIFFVTRNKIEERIIPNFQKNVFNRILKNNFMINANILIKREVLNKIGLFDERLNFGEDWDFLIRIAQKYNFYFVNRPLYKYYHHDTNIMQTLNVRTRKKDLNYLFKKYKKYYISDPGLYSARLRNDAICYLSINDLKTTRESLLKSIKVCPLNFKSYTYFAILLLFGLGFLKRFIRFETIIIGNYRSLIRKVYYENLYNFRYKTRNN